MTRPDPLPDLGAGDSPAASPEDPAQGEPSATASEPLEEVVSGESGPTPAHVVALRAFCHAAISAPFGAIGAIAPLVSLHVGGGEAFLVMVFVGLSVGAWAFAATLTEEFARRGERPLLRIALASLGFPFFLWLVFVWLISAYDAGPERAMLQVADSLADLPTIVANEPASVAYGAAAFLIPFAGFLIGRTRRELDVGPRYALSLLLGVVAGACAVLSMGQGSGATASLGSVLVGATLAVHLGFDLGGRIASRIVTAYQARTC